MEVPPSSSGPSAPGPITWLYASPTLTTVGHIAYLLIVYHLCRPEGKLLESKDLVSLHVITSDNEQPFSRYVWDE